MKTTMLDGLIASCLTNKERLHVFAGLDSVLRAAPPIAHIWDVPNPLQVPLEPKNLLLPDAAMCLCVPAGIMPGNFRFCIDQDVEAPILEDWIGRYPWSLEGLLIYQFSAQAFDAIPLARRISNGNMVMPEMQINFELTPEGWIWKKSTIGQVNAFFHDVMLRMIEDQSGVEESIGHLGNVINYLLGSYMRYLQQPGSWDIQLPRDPKLKLKNGKVKKVYQAGTVGYRQFVPKGA